MNKTPLPQCPHCGQEFGGLQRGKIPNHDFPKLCRSVCPGSRESPRSSKDAPLWKDDPEQHVRDFVDHARRELLMIGFAVVKQIGVLRGKPNGVVDCPLCGWNVNYRISDTNGHCAAKCQRKGCINAME